MAKLLKKTFGLVGKKSGHKSDCSAQKSSSTQELTPKSPTRYQSSVSLSTSCHQDAFDTHSLKLSLDSVIPITHGHCSSGNRHEHIAGKHQHNSCHRHQGSCSKEQASLSPRGSSSNDVGHHSMHSASVAEESDVFDDSPLDGVMTSDSMPNATQPSPVTPPKVLDEYCDPVDLKRNVNAIEEADMFGGFSQNHLLPDDDYSVPYEVKKVMPEGKLRERFLSNGKHLCNGSPAKVHDFDEPQEWLAQLSNVSGGEFSQQRGSGSQQTPMMTPKKFTKQVASDGGDSNFDCLEADNGQEPVGYQRESSSAGVAKGISASITSMEILQMGKSSSTGDKLLEENALTSKYIACSPSSDILATECVSESSADASNSNSAAVVVDNLTVKSAINESEQIVQQNVAVSTHTSHRQCKHSSKHGSSRHSCHSTKNSSSKKLHHSRSDESADTDSSSAPFTHKDIVIANLPLEQQSWYHGPLGRGEAEELLRQQPQGSFLVRESESNKQDYSLSLKSTNDCLHLKIVGQNGNYVLGQFSQPFESILHMVEFFCQARLPLRGNEQISLTHPLLRAGNV